MGLGPADPRWAEHQNLMRASSTEPSFASLAYELVTQGRRGTGRCVDHRTGRRVAPRALTERLADDVEPAG
jgi:hypothetical protein